MRRVPTAGPSRFLPQACSCRTFARRLSREISGFDMPMDLFAPVPSPPCDNPPFHWRKEAHGIQSRAPGPSDWRHWHGDFDPDSADSPDSFSTSLAPIRTLPDHLVSIFRVRPADRHDWHCLFRPTATVSGHWRTGWDSNPRWAFTHGGFQDRCLKPLGHLSGSGALAGKGALTKTESEAGIIAPLVGEGPCAALSVRSES